MRLDLSQGLQQGDPSQGHEGEQQKDAFQRIVALGHREELAAVSQQNVLQQRRERKKPPPEGTFFTRSNSTGTPCRTPIAAAIRSSVRVVAQPSGASLSATLR